MLSRRRRGVDGIRRNLAARVEIRLHRVDGIGLHARIRDVERDPGAVLFPVRHANRIAGSSISKGFPRAKMGQTGGELLDSVRE